MPSKKQHRFKRTCPHCRERFEANKSTCPHCGSIYVQAKDREERARERAYRSHTFGMGSSAGSGIATFLIDTVRFWFQRRKLKQQREERARQKKASEGKQDTQD
jgi:hypothetical protein